MRTINEIKRSMTDVFIANETVKAAYGLEVGKTFDEQFSKVSIESILFYIFAACTATLEWLFDCFRAEVEARIKAATPGTEVWYHDLVMRWEYNGERLIQFCSVTEQFPNLRIKVNTAEHGIIAQESDEMIALRSYINRNKFAGTQIRLTSEPPEVIDIEMNVRISAAMYAGNGANLATGEKSVEIAIDNYLENIVYDGTFFRSRLVDAVQAVEGVNDVELLSAKINNVETLARQQSRTGAFVANNTINYELY